MNYKYKYDKYKMKYIEKLKKVGGNNDLKNEIEKLLNCMNEFNNYLNSNFENDVNLTVLYENGNYYIEKLKLFNNLINKQNNKNDNEINNEINEKDKITNKDYIINTLKNKYLTNNDDDYILQFFILIITELTDLKIDFYNYIDLNYSIINNYDLLVDHIIRFFYKININIIKNINNIKLNYPTDNTFYYSKNGFFMDKNNSRFSNVFNKKIKNIYDSDSINLSKNDKLKNIINLCYWRLNSYLSNEEIMNELNKMGDLKKDNYYITLNTIFNKLINKYNELKNGNNY
jgi:hypothetical protein